MNLNTYLYHPRSRRMINVLTMTIPTTALMTGTSGSTSCHASLSSQATAKITNAASKADRSRLLLYTMTDWTPANSTSGW